MKSLSVIAAALLILVAAAPSEARTVQDDLPVERNAACGAGGGAVDEAGFVTVGGIRQWVTIDGRDCANPVVLMVHGGPGNPNTPYADAVFGDWTTDFTVVQWDQRGSGKTYGANPPGEHEPLTIEQLTRDGIEIARFATWRLGKRKVIVMGGSWGSALAVHMVQAQPDLFHAYVGTAQLVNDVEGLRIGYERTLDRARAAGDADTVGGLEALGPPPWTNPRNFGILRRATRKYEALTTEPPPSEWYRTPGAGYDTPAYEADYRAGEDYSYIQFVGYAGDGIASRLNLRDLGLEFRMPVFMLQGEEDLVTPPETSLAYFNDLTAPHKAFIRLARTGHDPNPIMIDAQLEVLQGLRREVMATDREQGDGVRREGGE